MVPKIYISEVSPAARATIMAVKALGIDAEFVPINLILEEHMKPEYLKLNPLHTVPTLEDDNFAIWDSHAINCYLADKYGKDDTLYPKDLEKRAVIHQRMFFDVGILFPKMGRIIVSLLKEGAKTINKEMADSLTSAYGQLETLLELNAYIAGDRLTLADFSIISTLTTANILVPIAANRFPKITDYIARMQKLPYYNDTNQRGVDMLTAFIKSKLA